MKNPLSIAIFSDTFLPQRDGIVTALLTEAIGLAKRGHKIILVVPKRQGRVPKLHPNITIVPVPSVSAQFYPGFRWTAPYSTDVAKIIAREKVDVIHFLTPFTIGMQAILIAKQKKIPLVGTFHTFVNDQQYMQHAKLDKLGVEGVVWRYLKLMYNRADLVSCPAPSTQRTLRAQQVESRITVISNGIAVCSPDPRVMQRTRKHLAGNSKVLLFVGRIAHEKNIATLLLVFQEVLQTVRDVKLVVIGGGPQLKASKLLAKNLGISAHVVFLGEVPNEKLIEGGYFGMPDVFVTASRTENQPMTVLEAQSHAVPVVGFRSRGIPDLVQDGVNGFTVAENDVQAFAQAVTRILTKKTLRAQLSRGAKRLVREHNTEAVLDAWEGAYRSLIERKRRTL